MNVILITVIFVWTGLYKFAPHVFPTHSLVRSALDRCWSTVYDTGPALGQRGVFLQVLILVIASVIRLTMHAQRTCYVGRCWCWSRVSDPGPTLDRYWYSVSCLLVCAFIAQQTRHVDPSTTPGQHWPSPRSMCRVCWVCSSDTYTCHYKTNIALLITVKSILYR